jgi:hypothetical protein
LVKLPVSAMAIKLRNWSMSSSAVMAKALGIRPFGRDNHITDPDRSD